METSVEERGRLERKKGIKIDAFTVFQLAAALHFITAPVIIDVNHPVRKAFFPSVTVFIRFRPCAYIGRLNGALSLLDMLDN